MSEPKKETVRIVLPPKREGQTLASTPRESAMINLPPKPVAAPAVPSSPAVPPPSIPKPAGLTPPSAPGLPKPPSFPGVPKPPGAPGAPVAPPPPKPLGAAPSAPVAPSPAPKPAPVGPTPIAVKPQAKKETAKVAAAPGLPAKPQATVRLQPRPVPTQLAGSAFNVQSTEPVLDETSEEEIPMNFAIAAVVTAVIALAVQLLFLAA